MAVPPIYETLLDRFLQASEFDLDVLRDSLVESDRPALAVRETLERANKTCDQLFSENADINALVALRSWFMDQVLAALWQRFDFDDNTSLIAVGGYGRGELHPHSDIDLLMLAKAEINDTTGIKLSEFITLLWDLRLDIGHSVRTIEECIESAKEDVTIATNLLETRTISGNDELRARVSKHVYSDEVYTSKDYFLAKRDEQNQRHIKYSGTEYNLEPNLKSSPGTLRDIQTIAWITKRHFGPDTEGPRQRYHFLTDEEFNMLVNGEAFLWLMRYGLQVIANRNENRLLFDHQRKLAEMLGYQDTDEKLGVEQMMQQYYRTVLGLAELADVILQYFDDYYLNPDQERRITPVNKRFHINNGYLEASDPEIFERSPYALIEIFLLMAQDETIKGIKATTIRLIREHQYLIDDSFRNDLANTTLFMEILRTPHKLHRTLNSMLKYNVLGRYLPEFGAIIGQMQHDLFHCFTVDAHTIKLIRNIVRLEHPDARQKFPLAARLLHVIPKRELLFIAGIYHDIAKGRGGDHSKLGVVDVTEFADRHHLSERDTKLLAWLVENHLLMSMTAQKKDIADPDVILQFAQRVPSLTHLEYLHILTVCDIAATNPSLWNSWRSSLMQQLYIETRRTLRRGIDEPVDRNDWIRATRQEVRTMLFEQGFAAKKVDQLLDSLDDDYFLQDSTSELAWQTAAILNHGDSETPLISIKDNPRVQENDGFSHIMVYLKSEQDLFAATTAVLEQLNLNVLNARINASASHFSLSNFVVTDAQHQALASDPERKKQVLHRLCEELDDPEDYPEIISRRTPRQLKHFSFPTEVTLSNDAVKQHTVMEVVTPDRPGLLARVGQVLLSHNLSLSSAKIATLGERVEDVFYLTDNTGTPVSDPEVCTALQTQICEMLDEQLEQH